MSTMKAGKSCKSVRFIAISQYHSSLLNDQKDGYDHVDDCLEITPVQQVNTQNSENRLDNCVL